METAEKKKSLRYRLYEVVEFVDVTGDGMADYDVYDVVMIVVIFASLIPLMVKEESPLTITIDKVTVAVFIFDYFLRWSVADYKLKKKGILSFLLYPFTFMAIVDLLSIIPVVLDFRGDLNMVRMLRVMRSLRVFRVLKAARYSNSIIIISEVLNNSKKALMAVGTLAIGYIMISAMMIFNLEPETFNSFFDAVYWATVSLTTVGYGDIYPVTMIGRLVSMMSSLFGIAIVALPAGIITAGYMEELVKRREFSEEFWRKKAEEERKKQEEQNKD